jgi:hypothetical protein
MKKKPNQSPEPTSGLRPAVAHLERWAKKEKKMRLGHFPRLWLGFGGIFLLMFSWLLFTPLEKVPLLPSFRGTGSPFLLARRLLPEEYARGVGVACLFVSLSMLGVAIYHSRSLRAQLKEEAILPYQREEAKKHLKR